MMAKVLVFGIWSFGNNFVNVYATKNKNVDINLIDKQNKYYDESIWANVRPFTINDDGNVNYLAKTKVNEVVVNHKFYGNWGDGLISTEYGVAVYSVRLTSSGEKDALHKYIYR